MENKTIAIPIELAEQVKEQIGKMPATETALTPLHELHALLKENFASSERDIWFRTMRGEWEPEEDQHYSVIDITTGKVVEETVSGSVYNFVARDGFVYAPPELAQTLSDVINGLYRPTQLDIDERVLFWQYWVEDGVCTREPMTAAKSGGVEGWLYFFTEPQRANYALRQQEKEAEPESDSERFYSIDGEIFFARKTHEQTGTNTAKYVQRAAAELNRMRTELTRLSKLHPND